MSLLVSFLPQGVAPLSFHTIQCYVLALSIDDHRIGLKTRAKGADLADATVDYATSAIRPDIFYLGTL